MKVLMIVDMLNAFAKEGGSLFSPAAKAIIPFIKEKIEEYLAAGYYIFFLCDSHDKNDKEFERFPIHAVTDTDDAMIVEELMFAFLNNPQRVRIINKKRFSAFYNTTLDKVIEYGGLREATFEFVGVCTGICDMDTIGDCANRDYKTAIYTQGIADLPAAAYDVPELRNPAGILVELQDIWVKRMAFVYGTEIL